MRTHITKTIIFSILITVFAWLPATAQPVMAAAKMPGLDAKITKENVQKILNKYDPDGAYIIKKQLAAGDKILQWFGGGNRIIDDMDTAIHEETHGYHYRYAKKGKYAFFVGKKKTVYVGNTKVYPSKKMASSIPKRLRTFRYPTYVAKPIKNLGSNVEGAYGLLNEFMAYRSGMNNTISLYPYYASQNADWDEWQIFVMDCENDRLAYAEFKYYILHYLHYAKKHYPNVYKGIVGNKQFCKAYRRLENSYVKLINAYGKDLVKLQQFFAKKGCHMEITDDSVMVSMKSDNDYQQYEGEDGEIISGSSYGIGRYTADYKKLQKELQKKRYKTIHKKLVKNGK